MVKNTIDTLGFMLRKWNDEFSMSLQDHQPTHVPV